MVSFSQLLQGYKFTYNLKWKLIKKIQGLGLKWTLKPKSLGSKIRIPSQTPAMASSIIYFLTYHSKQLFINGQGFSPLKFFSVLILFCVKCLHLQKFPSGIISNYLVCQISRNRSYNFI